MNSRGALAGVLLLVTAVAAAADGAAASERTWRALDEVAEADRVMMDMRLDAPRAGADPTLPDEPYPYSAPYTAEEIGFRIMTFNHMARWSHAFADVFGAITKNGYLTQGVISGVTNQTDHGHGATAHIHGKPGDIHSEYMWYYTYPPRNKGLQELWLVRRTGAEQHTKLDYFIYSPSLRRVRRQPPPRRETAFPDNVQSFDDVSGIEAWEFSWRFIGTDVLHETVRFPNTRPHITLTKPDGSYYERATTTFRLMGDSYPFYRPDGGVDCYVIVAEPKRDWLPDYTIAKLIYWVDKHYFYPLRLEQYDKAGTLKTVQVRFAEKENPNLPDGEGYTNNQSVYYDAVLDLLSYSVHDAHTVHTWSADEEEFFTPDFMRRRWLAYPKKSQALIESPDQFYLRPQLLLERFPHERTIQLAPDVAARIAEQEAAGHLVFGAAEE